MAGMIGDIEDSTTSGGPPNRIEQELMRIWGEDSSDSAAEQLEDMAKRAGVRPPWHDDFSRIPPRERILNQLSKVRSRFLDDGSVNPDSVPPADYRPSDTRPGLARPFRR